jgi:hypothetical protein
MALNKNDGVFIKTTLKPELSYFEKIVLNKSLSESLIAPRF